MRFQTTLCQLSKESLQCFRKMFFYNQCQFPNEDSNASCLCSSHFHFKKAFAKTTDSKPSLLRSITSLFRLERNIKPKAELRKEFQELRAHLESLNSPVVFCHNDLLPKNIIYNEKSGKHITNNENIKSTCIEDVQTG